MCGGYLSVRMIRSNPNYNEGLDPHKLNLNKHSLFVDCIGAIDGTHVKAVLLQQEHMHFIGQKGEPTQNVSAACDFNLCFIFVLTGHTENTHDARLLACAIYSSDIHFLLQAWASTTWWTSNLLIDQDIWHRTKGWTSCIASNSFGTSKRDDIVAFVMLVRSSTSDTHPAETSSNVRSGCRNKGEKS